MATADPAPPRPSTGCAPCPPGRAGRLLRPAAARRGRRAVRGAPGPGPPRVGAGGPAAAPVLGHRHRGPLDGVPARRSGRPRGPGRTARRPGAAARSRGLGMAAGAGGAGAADRAVRVRGPHQLRGVRADRGPGWRPVRRAAGDLARRHGPGDQRGRAALDEDAEHLRPVCDPGPGRVLMARRRQPAADGVGRPGGGRGRLAARAVAAAAGCGEPRRGRPRGRALDRQPGRLRRRGPRRAPGPAGHRAGPGCDRPRRPTAVGGGAAAGRGPEHEGDVRRRGRGHPLVVAGAGPAGRAGPGRGPGRRRRGRRGAAAPVGRAARLRAAAALAPVGVAGHALAAGRRGADRAAAGGDRAHRGLSPPPSSSSSRWRCCSPVSPAPWPPPRPGRPCGRRSC